MAFIDLTWRKLNLIAGLKLASVSLVSRMLFLSPPYDGSTGNEAHLAAEESPIAPNPIQSPPSESMRHKTIDESREFVYCLVAAFPAVHRPAQDIIAVPNPVTIPRHLLKLPRGDALVNLETFAASVYSFFPKIVVVMARLTLLTEPSWRTPMDRRRPSETRSRPRSRCGCLPPTVDYQSARKTSSRGNTCVPTLRRSP